MEDLCELLDYEFYNHYNTVGRSPLSVIAHPITVKNLYFEILKTMYLSETITDFKYRGVKIYRSVDIEENKFIIG